MGKRRVMIVDYQMSNLFSVLHACEYIGFDAFISPDKSKLRDADIVILPGVGAFGDAMDNLFKLDLVEPIKDYVKTNKPFFGVCLGLQLLFSQSEEFGLHKGLGLITGKVVKFPNNNKQCQVVKIPQIGWNRIYHPEYKKVWSKSLLHGLPNNEYMYFVHSFYAVPEDSRSVVSYTSYEGVEYCSSVKCNNIFATQFHPEKSGPKGLVIYKNLIDNLI